MLSENGLTGRALIDATTKEVEKMYSTTFRDTRDKIREHVVSAYESVEYFDGESVDPKAFAKAIKERILWKGKL